MSPQTMEQLFEEAVAAHDLPGVVLLAKDRSGQFNYEHSFGPRKLSSENAGLISPDSIMWVASLTKLFTSICLLQLVERGQLSLETDIVTILPELAELEILTGFTDDGQPILKPRTRPMTLTQCLTHTAGFSDDAFPDLARWRAGRGEKSSHGKTVKERYFHPLTFEAGTAWGYGCGIDWAGKVVEKLSGLTLDAYMDKYLFRPLGIKDATFFPKQRPDMVEKMAGPCARDGNGKAVGATEGYLPEGMDEASGGLSLFASPGEYIKVLHSLLKDDGKLLQTETLDLLFKPAMSEEAEKMMNGMLSVPLYNTFLGGGTPVGTSRSWALGGLSMKVDVDGKNWLRKGTMAWCGMPNLFWFIDRATGLCGLYASQILPLGDTKSVEMQEKFSRAIYERYQDSEARA